MTSTVRHADAVDLEPAARTLALAFDDYAWTRWVVPADGYPARLEELQTLYLRHALEHGVVLVDQDTTGVVALLPASAPAPGPAFLERVAALHGDRLDVLSTVALPERPPGAWDLATLGVRPDRRGAGTGSTLVAAGLAAVGPVDVALETSDARTVRLYERHGFAVTARTTPPGGPDVWSMLRPAPAG